MAEALAAIGLAAAIVQFTDFASRLIRQVRQLTNETADQPKVFRGVQARLPLMIDLVTKIKLQMEAGLIDKATQEHMLPIVQSCGQQAQHLQEVILKVLPSSGDSSWTRGRKALFGVLQDSEIEKIDNVLKQNFDLLLQAGTFQSVSRIDEKGNQHASPSYTVNPVVHLNFSVDDTGRRSSSANDRALRLDEYLTRRESSVTRAVFTVPFSRDSNFIGRQSTIEEISKRFETQRYVSLDGLGGIGKSQIAIEYSYVFKELHPASHVFWVYAGNSVRFEHGYQTIARKLAIPGWDDEKVNILELVHDWMIDEQTENYLLVLDNADDASMFFRLKSDSRAISNERENTTPTGKTLARYLPINGPGLVLITTRDKRLGERLSSRERSVKVGFMSATDSIELLRSKIVDADWNESDASRLIKELSYLPLAITQAAAFISENCITISDYLDQLYCGKEDMEELLLEHLEDSRRELDTENSVIRTWKLSFDQLSKTAPRAAEMLSLLAVLDLQGALQSLLRRNQETLTPFRTALGTLQAFSLVNAARGTDSLCKMHRLVALSTRKWLEISGSLSYWQSEALRLLEERFPDDAWSTPDVWADAENLYPHTQTILSYPLTTPDDLLCTARLLLAVGIYDLIRGKYDEACKKSRRSLEIREEQFPENDHSVLKSRNMLGESLLCRGYPGDLQAAKDIFTKQIQGREQTLGPLHPDTLESVSDLTIVLLALDEIDAAMETSQRALKGRQETLGPEDRDTLVSLHVYALALQRKGDLSEARAMTERALKGREQLLGPDHPEAIMTLNNLARVCIDQDELVLAKEMLERVMARERKVLGAEGYDIQVSLSNMALVLEKQQDFQGAEATLRKVLAMRTKFSGPEHSSTVLVLQMLLDLFEHKGDTDSAEAMTLRIKSLSIGSNGVPQAGALLRAGLLFD